jgi:hypothetical protein
MRRLKLVVVVAALSALALVGTALAGSRPVPILTGPKPMGGAGFGQVKPSKIYLGGDPTGLVCRIRWLSWGGELAVGDGTGWYINSHQAVSQGKAAPVVVVLYDLGTWRGRPAYKRYDWYFPGGGSGFGHVSGCTA